MGVFSRSSASSGGELLRAEKISTPLLFLAVPLIPLFLGDEDLGSRVDAGVPRVRRAAENGCLGVVPMSTQMLEFQGALTGVDEDLGYKIEHSINVNLSRALYDPQSFVSFAQHTRLFHGFHKHHILQRGRFARRGENARDLFHSIGI